MNVGIFKAAGLTILLTALYNAPERHQAGQQQ